MDNLVIFGLGASKPYAEKACDYLQIKISTLTEKKFEDGESYLKSNVNVRGADVYIISSLYRDSESLGDKLTNLLWFVGSLKDASAERITIVTPYLCFSRQDRKTESRAPITTKYMAQVFEAVGVNRVLTLDVHSLAAFQNSFRIPVDNLTATRLFVDHLTVDPIDFSNLAIVSPDNGGLNRCALFQKALHNRIERILGKQIKEIPLAVFDKRRIDGQVEGSRIIGDVKGKQCIILDDMIASGNTIIKAAEAIENEGGEIYAVCATHGQFTKPKMIEDMLGHQIDTREWIDVNKKPLVKRLIVTDSINQTNDFYGGLTVIDTTRFIGEAIKRTHLGGSISELLEC